MCLFKKLFLKFFTGNRLHSYVFEGSWLFKLNFKSFVAGNRLHINGNQLQLLNSNFKILLKADFSKLSSDNRLPEPWSWINLSSGNRLHCLVIDYQSLDLLNTLYFEAKAWWINLEAMLICWNNLVLILKQYLTFECLLK